MNHMAFWIDATHLPIVPFVLKFVDHSATGKLAGDLPWQAETEFWWIGDSMDLFHDTSSVQASNLKGMAGYYRILIVADPSNAQFGSMFIGFSGWIDTHFSDPGHAH
jgi:hypothetical protein